MNEASDAALPLWAQHAIWIAGQPEVMMVLAGLLLASLFAESVWISPNAAMKCLWNAVISDLYFLIDP